MSRIDLIIAGFVVCVYARSQLPSEVRDLPPKQGLNHLANCFWFVHFELVTALSLGSLTVLGLGSLTPHLIPYTLLTLIPSMSERT